MGRPKLVNYLGNSEGRRTQGWTRVTIIIIVIIKFITSSNNINDLMLTLKSVLVYVRACAYVCVCMCV